MIHYCSNVYLSRITADEVMQHKDCQDIPSIPSFPEKFRKNSIAEFLNVAFNHSEKCIAKT